jgi:hypothetical protein
MPGRGFHIAGKESIIAAIYYILSGSPYTVILLNNTVFNNIIGVGCPPIKTALGLWIFENRVVANIINSTIAETASSFLNLRRI